LPCTSQKHWNVQWTPAPRLCQWTTSSGPVQSVTRHGTTESVRLIPRGRASIDSNGSLRMQLVAPPTRRETTVADCVSPPTVRRSGGQRITRAGSLASNLRTFAEHSAQAKSPSNPRVAGSNPAGGAAQENVAAAAASEVSTTLSERRTRCPAVAPRSEAARSFGCSAMPPRSRRRELMGVQTIRLESSTLLRVSLGP